MPRRHAAVEDVAPSREGGGDGLAADLLDGPGWLEAHGELVADRVVPGRRRGGGAGGSRIKLNVLVLLLALSSSSSRWFHGSGVMY